MTYLFRIQNETGQDMDNIISFIDEYYPYAKEKIPFDQPVTIRLVSDESNAADDLGKTGYYDPAARCIVVYVDNRHPKDIMRSINHELVHHAQNCRGEFDEETTERTGEQGYVLNDEKLRNLEKEAYEGQLIFREFEDLRKRSLQEKRNENLYETLKKEIL